MRIDTHDFKSFVCIDAHFFVPLTRTNVEHSLPAGGARMTERRKISIGQAVKQAFTLGHQSNVVCNGCGRNWTMTAEDLIRLPMRLTDSITDLEARLRCRTCGHRGAQTRVSVPHSNRSSLSG